MFQASSSLTLYSDQDHSSKRYSQQFILFWQFATIHSACGYMKRKLLRPYFTTVPDRFGTVPAKWANSLYSSCFCPACADKSGDFSPVHSWLFMFIHLPFVHFAPPPRLLIDFKNTSIFASYCALLCKCYFLSHISLTNKFTRFFIYFLFLSDEGPTLETLDFTIRIGSIPTFLYFDLYLYSAHATHYVYFKISHDCVKQSEPCKFCYRTFFYVRVLNTRQWTSLRVLNTAYVYVSRKNAALEINPKLDDELTNIFDTWSLFKDFNNALVLLKQL